MVKYYFKKPCFITKSPRLDQTRPLISWYDTFVFADGSGISTAVDSWYTQPCWLWWCIQYLLQTSSLKKSLFFWDTLESQHQSQVFSDTMLLNTLVWVIGLDDSIYSEIIFSNVRVYNPHWLGEHKTTGYYERQIRGMLSRAGRCWQALSKFPIPVTQILACDREHLLCWTCFRYPWLLAPRVLNIQLCLFYCSNTVQWHHLFVYLSREEMHFFF